MKIAYLILAHADPKQLNRLIFRINYNCKIFIHVDKKSDINKFLNFDLPGNTEFIDTRIPVYWAGYNMIDATLALMKAALNSTEQYSHLVMLSGMDYPIKPVSQLYDLLISSKDKQFIKFIDIEDSPEYYLKRAHNYWFYDQWFPKYDNKLRKVAAWFRNLYATKPLLENIRHAYGCQMWAITPDCADYTVNYADSHVEFVNWHKTSPAPDETFFHTIVANSPFIDETEGWQEYKGRGVYQYTNLHLIHPSAAKTYGVDDFDDIKNSDKYFVRKVTTERSSELLDRIDREILELDSVSSV